MSLPIPALLLLTVQATQDDAGGAPIAEEARVRPRVTQEQLETWTAAILEDIEGMRGVTFPRPVSVAVADGAGFRAYMAARMEKHTTPELIAAEESLAKLLGLIPATMDYMGTLQEMLDAQVGGFYDPDTEGFYLMERFGGDLARTILSHELTHALDDQLYDIDGTLESLDGNGDAEFAYQAVVEGSGTTLMNAWTMQHMAELDLAALADMDTMGTESLEDVPSYMWKPLLAVYLRGAAFLNRTDNTMLGSVGLPSNEDVRAAFLAPPRSSEQILHPDKYWREDRRDEPVPVTLDTGALPADWKVLDGDTLGEFGWGLLLQPEADRGGLENPLAVLGLRYTYPASEGWGGDRFVLLGRGDARVFHAHTVWDGERDAQEFLAAITAQLPRLRQAAGDCAATLEGDVASGARIGHDPQAEPLAVSLTVWFGAAEDEVVALVAGVRATVGAPDDDAR